MTITMTDKEFSAWCETFSNLTEEIKAHEPVNKKALSLAESLRVSLDTM